MEFDPQRFTKFMNTVGHNGLLGISYRAHGPGWAELALPWREPLVGESGTGILATGPILALFDIAMSYAIWIKRGFFAPQATLDMRVDYLRAARQGATVVARTHCYRVTRTIAFARGEAHDGVAEDPIAHVTGTFILNDGGGNPAKNDPAKTEMAARA